MSLHVATTMTGMEIIKQSKTQGLWDNNHTNTFSIHVERLKDYQLVAN